MIQSVDWRIGGSAKGAKYESQGQALSKAKRGAPGVRKHSIGALKERNKSFSSSWLGLNFPTCYSYPLI
jgi:hypothetical protein